MKIVVVLRSVLQGHELRLRHRLQDAADRLDYEFIFAQNNHWVNLCRLRSLMMVESNHVFVMRELAQNTECHEVLADVLKAV